MLKILLIILSVCLIDLECGEIQEEPKSYLLSNQTYPKSYLVILGEFNFDDDSLTDLTFTGTVTIDIAILETTKTITLHSSVKNITRIRKSVAGVRTFLNFTLDNEKEFLIIHEPDYKDFEINTTVTILIQFTGIINDFPTTEGLYRGFYLDGELKKHYFVATHMQPISARKVFPCYDEPRFKSVFNLTITHKAGYHAISNTDSYEDNDLTGPLGIFVRNFKRTALIPAYMLGFIISDFKSSEFHDFQSGLKFRVFAQPAQLDKTNYGLLTGVGAINSIKNYFNASYKSEKLDLVVLPQLSTDDTEYQGITFHQEDLFLYDKQTDPVYKSESVSRTIFNKICQTFIGSTLTQSWWSSLWVNNGLCKLYEYQMTDSIYPEMKLKNIFAIEVMQPEMNHDSSSSARLLTWDEASPSEIRSMFDSISYSKAASVMRMFYHALSEKTFRHGLQIYINKSTSNPEGIAEPKHFYEALQLAVNDPSVQVANDFETWEFQAGYPILDVTKNYNGNNIMISQKRFTDDIKNGTASNKLWSIPISYSTKSNPNLNTLPQMWLREENSESVIEDLHPSDYIIVNVDQTGYYRVMYDVINWLAIAKELNQGSFKDISPNTRAMLIDDAGTFMEMEILDIKIFLEIINYLQHETDYIPLVSATNNLLYMKRMLNDGSSQLYIKFQKRLQKLFTKVFETYGVKEQNKNEHYEKHIRNIAINWACQAHLPACLSQTKELFEKGIMNSEVTISTDHIAAIMCNGAITGNARTYSSLWKNYEKFHQILYLKSIGCIQDEAVLRLYIQQYKDVADDEWFTVIQSVYSNGPIGLKVAMEFLDKNFTEFYIFITQHHAFGTLDTIFQEIADHITTDQMFSDFTLLTDEYGITQSLKDSLTALIEKNLKWIEKNSPIIDIFLNSSTTAVSLTAILFGVFVQYFVR